MQKRGAIGYDESNHGKFPEIFVAVYSNVAEDILKSEHLITKGTKRIKKPLFLEESLAVLDFKHIIISKEFKQAFGERGIQVIVLSEFIKHFAEKEIGVVLADGYLPSSVIKRVKKIIYPIVGVDIRGIPEGDRRYPLINKADIIANTLYRLYKQPDADKSYYLKNLLSPKLEDYARILSE